MLSDMKVIVIAAAALLLSPLYIACWLIGGMQGRSVR